MGELNNEKLVELVEEIARGTGAMQESQKNQKDTTERLENRINHLPTNETIDLKIANMRANVLADIEAKFKELKEQEDKDEKKQNKNNETVTTKHRDKWNVFKDWILIIVGILTIVLMLVALAG